MKLSRFYSDDPAVFGPIEFLDGLNVVLAEIRLPENKAKDTHNLGKSMLGRLLDFGFLAKRDQNFFLFKHIDRFERFTFFLEIQLTDGSFVTVRRSARDSSRIAFKKHVAKYQDFAFLPDDQWDHCDVAFERAQELLDSFLDWRGLKPWGYRKGLGYFLRSQVDFQDVFHLRKFMNKHADWKPFLAHILGFDADLIAKRYEKEAELAASEARATTIRQEMAAPEENAGKIDGMLQLKRQDVDKKQALLDSFDFRSQDKAKTKELVDEVDQTIADLNARRYSLSQNKKKVANSLKEDEIIFDPEEAKKLFQEAGVLFEGQIKRDFKQLIAFNRSITDERRNYLVEEQAEIEAELKVVNSQLTTLGKKRSEMLSFLGDTDTFRKYKQLSNELVVLRADITTLERQKLSLTRLNDLKIEIRKLGEECTHLLAEIEADLNHQNAHETSRFAIIRSYFNEIVEAVIDRKALLSVTLNKEGHMEFKAEILDEAGNATSAAAGFTYKKLLCVAFDLAVLRAHINERFPRFAYHDGILESLDDRKKHNLIEVLREYTDLGIQSLITMIDSDLPALVEDEEPLFATEEIVVLLHDEGESGRLFRMPSW
ncbi:DUF2326 domain-containing protein [Asticcacaulis sp.]|uniref:DUF2326 domain-containing protein n=1 Tax=Asticcacaulis sp. TaxID=1872648 RepID=UPI002BD28713|nr:DUF2326 domain-containing protein [Asticcacaulis sp.]HTM81940.1 DUF2326 domain-containing protein [Asticcacaulis sp.]